MDGARSSGVTVHRAAADGGSSAGADATMAGRSDGDVTAPLHRMPAV